MNLKQRASRYWECWGDVGARGRLVLGLQALLVAGTGLWLLMRGISSDTLVGTAQCDSILTGNNFPVTAFVIWESSLVLAAFAPLRPMLGVWAYVLIAYVVPRYSPENSFALDFGLAELAVLFAITGWAGWLYRRRERFSWPGHWPGVLLAALLGWGIVSFVAAGVREGYSPVVPWHHPIQYVEGLLLFLLVARFFDGRRDAIWLGCVALAIVTIRGRVYPDYNYLNNDLGAWIAMGLPLAALAVVAIRTWWARGILSGLVLHFFWLLYATRNRAGAVATAAAMGVGWLLAHSRVKWFVLFVAIPVLLIGGHWVVQRSDFGKRFRDIVEGGRARATVDSRLEIWRGAWLMIEDYPVLGVGPSRFYQRLGDYSDLKEQQPHNNLLAMAAEFGVPGLVLYSAFFTCVLTMAILIGWRDNDLWPGVTCQATAAALVAYLVIGLFLTRHDMVFAYILAGIPVAVWRGHRDRLETRIDPRE